LSINGDVRSRYNLRELAVERNIAEEEKIPADFIAAANSNSVQNRRQVSIAGDVDRVATTMLAGACGVVLAAIF